VSGDGQNSLVVKLGVSPSVQRFVASITHFNRLGGVVVSVLTIGLEGRRFELAKDDGFLRAITIRSTPSFGWEVKPEISCRKILRGRKD
jgi:hypothetical protein